MPESVGVEPVHVDDELERVVVVDDAHVRGASAVPGEQRFQDAVAGLIVLQWCCDGSSRLFPRHKILRKTGEIRVLSEHAPMMLHQRRVFGRALSARLFILVIQRHGGLRHFLLGCWLHRIVQYFAIFSCKGLSKRRTGFQREEGRRLGRGSWRAAEAACRSAGCNVRPVARRIGQEKHA